MVSSVGILSLGCVTRGEIKAAIWMNNGSDPALCGPSRAESKNPVLWDHGVFRRLNSGGFEFLSFCHPAVREYFAISRADLETILNETLPREDADAVMTRIYLDRQAGTRALAARAKKRRR